MNGAASVARFILTVIKLLPDLISLLCQYGLIKLKK